MQNVQDDSGSSSEDSQGGRFAGTTQANSEESQSSVGLAFGSGTVRQLKMLKSIIKRLEESHWELLDTIAGKMDRLNAQGSINVGERRFKDVKKKIIIAKQLRIYSSITITCYPYWARNWTGRSERPRYEPRRHLLRRGRK